MKRPAATIFLLFFTFEATARSQTPIGPQFQVNTYTTSNQTYSSVAAADNGDFIVVWDSFGSYGTDTDSSSIQAQRYDSAGSPIGGQFQVNTFTTSYQFRPEVAIHAAGDFLVAWEGRGNNDIPGIHVQRYTADGVPLGGQFQVNTTAFSYGGDPVAAMNADGGFVVVWRSGDVLGRLYDSAGNPLGGEFQVSSTGRGGRPFLAMDADGNFVVAYRDPFPFFLMAKRFSADGTPIGGSFQVRTDTSYEASDPGVGMDADGNFVVVWNSYQRGDNYEPGGDVAWAHRFDSAGTPAPDDSVISDVPVDSTQFIAVDMAPSGEAVVVWNSSEFPSFTNQAKALLPPTRTLTQFQVNTTTVHFSRPDVAIDASGRFVVIWDSSFSAGSDTDRSSIQGQRFSAPGTIFGDGFESGDTSAWSSSTQ